MQKTRKNTLGCPGEGEKEGEKRENGGEREETFPHQTGGGHSYKSAPTREKTANRLCFTAGFRKFETGYLEFAYEKTRKGTFAACGGGGDAGL